LARAQIFIAMRCPNARLGGMGDAFRQGTRPYHAIIAAILTLSVCTYMGVSGYLALSVCLFTSACLLAYACRRLGGVTGDVFGCSVEFSEWIVLLTFCAYAS
jgi:adenosylcobinamide-GDP ribazoletransferase